MSLSDALSSKYDQHDWTHDGVLEECQCENYCQKICPFSEQCTTEEREDCLRPYPLYKTLEEVSVSKIPETTLVYVHPSGGTIYHGPLLTTMLKKGKAAHILQYPYGTMDIGMDCYYIIGDYSAKYVTTMCSKVDVFTRKRKHQTLFQLIDEVGFCKNEDQRSFYTISLINMLSHVVLGETIYIQGEENKIHGLLYVLIGMLNLDSNLKFDAEGTLQHLKLVYQKHGKEFPNLSEYYQQKEIVEYKAYLRLALHISEVHGQYNLPDPTPYFLELPELKAPSAQAIKSILDKARFRQIIQDGMEEIGLRILQNLHHQSKCYRQLDLHLQRQGLKLCSRSKQHVKLQYPHVFGSCSTKWETERNSGLYVVD